MSVMVCTGVTFVKKISYLVARTISFETIIKILMKKVLETLIFKWPFI